MYKAPVKEVSTDIVDLPQIRFPAQRTMSVPDPAGDHHDIEKLRLGSPILYLIT